MYFLGVDLGTTYTAAAIVRDDRAEMVQLGTRAASIPSGVFLRDDGEVLVGEPAMRRGLVEPGRLATQTKRRFGDPVPLILGGTAYPVEMLTARLLRHVVDTVAAREGQEAANVAITHPANWGPYKLDLLSQVCAMADLDRFVLVAEPVGAAVHYAAQARVPDGATVLVYDLGGGTFDAAVLTKQGDGFEVVGRPEGVDRLGGVDVDAVVLRHVLDSLGPDADGIDGSDDAATAAMARLRLECVDAKEALSSDTDTDIACSWKGIDSRVRLTRVELESRCRVLLDESIAATRRALRGAGVAPADLDAVLLVGGASRMPLVAEMVAATLGRPVAVDVDPKHSVALGAARVAALAARSAMPVPTGSAGAATGEAPPSTGAAFDAPASPAARQTPVVGEGPPDPQTTDPVPAGWASSAGPASPEAMEAPVATGGGLPSTADAPRAAPVSSTAAAVPASPAGAPGASVGVPVMPVGGPGPSAEAPGASVGVPLMPVGGPVSSTQSVAPASPAEVPVSSTGAPAAVVGTPAVPVGGLVSSAGAPGASAAAPPSAAAPSAGVPSAGERRPGRSPRVAAVAAVVGVVAIIALALAMALLGDGGGDDADLDSGADATGAAADTDDGLTAAAADDDGSGAGADAGAGWISPCPTGSAAVCIEAVEFVGDELAISFRPQGVALSAPPLQGQELAPVFFLTAGTAERPDAALSSGADPRRWGPSSPMQGEGVAGDSGWSSSTLPGGASAVCVALFDANGSIRAGSGNCAALPG